MPQFCFYTTQNAKINRPHFFFNSPQYVAFHATDNTFSFFLQNETTEEVLATIHFELIGKTAYNPSKAPFGFLETSILDNDILSAFWQKVETELRLVRATRIEIRAWPATFFPHQNQIVSQVLIQQGFAVLFFDFNFHIPVTSSDCRNFFHSSELRRLRKCINAGFVFEQWSLEKVSEAYDLLEKFRNAHNIPFNIEKDVLIESCKSFPEKYTIFVVKDGEDIVALSICVQSENIFLYHFCPASNPLYSAFSPGVMLHEGIYLYCQKNSYLFFDLGTASIEGVRQDSLALFKTRLGAIESYKTTFFKDL